MLAPSTPEAPTAQPLPNRPIDAIDLLPLLGRVRRALDGALQVPRLSRVDEQRFSAAYVGLVDLEQRLRQVAAACATAVAPALLHTRQDLLTRTAVATELVECLTRLHRLDARDPEALAAAPHLARAVGALEARWGRALFA